MQATVAISMALNGETGVGMVLAAVCCAAAVVAAAAPAAAAPPATVLWTSSSASSPPAGRADGTLLLHGAFPGTPCLLRCQDAAGGTISVVAAAANSTTATSAAFVVPAADGGGAGNQTCRVRCGGAAESPPFAPRRPEIWWVQGDTLSGRANRTTGAPAAGSAETVKPGGLLRLFGRNLGAATARLVAAATGARQDGGAAEVEGPPVPVELAYDPLQSSENTATFTVPDSVGVGPTTWQVLLKNGASGCPFVAAAEPILVQTADGFDYTAVFKVAGLGLGGALAAAAAAPHGGVVEFGAGRFKMIGPINLPSLTVLRGAGMDATSLWWDDDANATAADHLIGSNGSYPCCRCSRSSLCCVAAAPTSLHTTNSFSMVSQSDRTPLHRLTGFGVR